MGHEAIDALVAISAVHQEYDLAARMLEAQIGMPLCIQCGKCCQGNTPFAHGVEAAHAVSWLIGQGKLYQFQRRIEGWLLDRHKECTLYGPQKLDIVTMGLDERLQAEALALARTPCPFYDQGIKGCLVYHVRPLACRAYGVTRNVPGCSRPRGKYESESHQIILSEPLRRELHAEVDAVFDRVPKPTWKYAGFFPTLIFAHAWPVSFQKMVSDGQVATAKVLMTWPSMAVLFQEQVGSLTDRDLFRTDQRELAQV